MKCKLSNEFYKMFAFNDIYWDMDGDERNKIFDVIRRIEDVNEFGSGVGYIIYNPSNHCTTTLDSDYIELLEEK